jgi:hypothetical protein
VEVDPQLYLRLDNVMIHGIRKVLAPLLHGIIDRRVASLTDCGPDRQPPLDQGSGRTLPGDADVA